MKKIISLVLSLIILVTIIPAKAYAKEPVTHISFSGSANSEIIYQDEEIIIEALLTPVPSSNIQLFSTKNKTSAKTASIKKASGALIGTFTLNASFSYNGRSSTCIKTSYSSSIKNTKWSFTSRTSSSNGNKAIGSCTIKNSSPGKSKSISITITCSKHGSIS